MVGEFATQESQLEHLARFLQAEPVHPNFPNRRIADTFFSTSGDFIQPLFGNVSLAFAAGRRLRARTQLRFGWNGTVGLP